MLARKHLKTLSNTHRLKHTDLGASKETLSTHRNKVAMQSYLYKQANPNSDREPRFKGWAAGKWVWRTWVGGYSRE